MKSQLLIRPTLAEDESLRGYIARAAERNLSPALFKPMLSSLSAATAAIPAVSGLTGSNQSDLCARGAVVGNDWSHRPGLQFGSIILSSNQVRFRQRMVCPLCLSEDGISRCTWELRRYDVCCHHGCHLIDTCGACQRPLSWNSPSCQTCVCGFQIAKSHMGKAAPSRQKFCQLLADAMRKTLNNQSQNLPGNISQIPAIDWMLLLISFAEALILPHFFQLHLTSPRPIGAGKQDELIATMLGDKPYRDHLRETLFLHAAKDPVTMGKALQPGLLSADLQLYFGPCLEDLFFHTCLWKLNWEVDIPADVEAPEVVDIPKAAVVKFTSTLDHKGRLRSRQRASDPGGITWRPSYKPPLPPITPTKLY